VVLYPMLPASFTHHPSVGVLSRALLWLVPGAAYLRLVYGRAWFAPLWLRIGPSRLHLFAIVMATGVVSALLLLGTARQRGVEPELLVKALLAQARPAFRTPILEELLFRGVIVGEFCRLAVRSAEGAVLLRLRYWGAQLAAGAFFVLIHWPFWLEYRGLDYAMTSSGPLLVTALVLGAVFVHTRSLWPCIALHWLNNQLSTLVLN
jgi:membrane protease YdiL (CAAX protease family)